MINKNFLSLKLHALSFLLILILAIIFTPTVYAKQVLSGGHIETLALAEIEAALDERGEFRRREINIMRSLSSITLPEGIIDVKILLPSTSINYSSLTPIKARIFVNGKPYRDVNVMASIKVFDLVLIANHDLHIETPVTESDFRIDEVAIDGRTEYLKDPAEVIGLVPHRFVRAGSPVTINYFQQPVAVESGHMVRIIFKQGGLQVSAKGIAMSRGRIGQVIKVRNEASQKILSAKVIDAQTVEVVS